MAWRGVAMVRCPIGKVQTVAQYLIASLDLSLVDAGPRILARSQMFLHLHGGVEREVPVALGKL